MIVTPILAVLGYYIADMVVKEQPHAPVAGRSYPLVAQSNCRYSSGECDLVNASFKSKLTVLDQAGSAVLQLESSHSLAGATVGLVVGKQEFAPTNMQSVNNSQLLWILPLPASVDQQTVMRIALKANDTHYFAETALAFSIYKTSFRKNF